MKAASRLHLVGAILLARGVLAQVPPSAIVSGGCRAIAIDAFQALVLDTAAFPDDNSAQMCGDYCYGQYQASLLTLAQQLCSCFNSAPEFEQLPEASRVANCQGQFSDELCGGFSADPGVSIYNAYLIVISAVSSTAVDGASSTLSTIGISSTESEAASTATTTTTTLTFTATSGDSTRSDPTNTGSSSSISTTTITSSTPSPSTGGGGGGSDPSTEVVTSTATSTTCPACSGSGSAVFEQVILITRAFVCSDGHMTTTVAPSVSTIYYDTALSTVTTIVDVDTTRVVLVTITRTATVAGWGNVTANGTATRTPTVPVVVVAGAPPLGLGPEGRWVGVAVGLLGVALGGVGFFL